jgi:hypothetical protein
MQGYRLRKSEWSEIKPRVIPEEELKSDGKLPLVQVNPDSVLFRQCLVMVQEHRLLAQLEREVQGALEKEGYAISVNNKELIDFL